MSSADKRICVNCVAGFPHPATQFCIENAETVEAAIANEIAKLGRPVSDGTDLKDAESTGRKRAAELLPTELLNTMICEWALLKEAGGGVYPIQGCHGNKATDRHHGPDKNTLNNERGTNLHAICSYCHNEWHAKNDSTYEGERPKGIEPWIPTTEFKQHNPNGEKLSVKDALIKELTRYK